MLGFYENLWKHLRLNERQKLEQIVRNFYLERNWCLHQLFHLVLSCRCCTRRWFNKLKKIIQWELWEDFGLRDLRSQDRFWNSSRRKMLLAWPKFLINHPALLPKTRLLKQEFENKMKTNLNEIRSWKNKQQLGELLKEILWKFFVFKQLFFLSCVCYNSA